jgi:3-mercaptopyruvate sulfurtransferase SseA
MIVRDEPVIGIEHLRPADVARNGLADHRNSPAFISSHSGEMMPARSGRIAGSFEIGPTTVIQSQDGTVKSNAAATRG